MVELAFLRVETLTVAVSEDHTELAQGASADRVGRLPPSRPSAILEEVASNALSRAAAYEGRPDVARESLFPDEPAPAQRLEAGDLRMHASDARRRARSSTEETVAGGTPASDPDAEQLAASLELVADVIEQASAALDVGGLTQDESVQATARPAAVRARVTDPGSVDTSVDQHAMRRLARHWELAGQTVQCRTVVRMDGDARTQFPPPSAQTASGDRVHAAIALVAMSLWPILLQAAGSVIAAVAGFGSRAWRAPRIAERQSSEPEAPAEQVKAFSFRELLDASWQFFALGRVVFESPARGPDAALRTMIHPSGDVETSVRVADVDKELVDLHGRTIQLWVQRLAVTLDRLRRRLDAIVVAASATSSGGAVVVFSQGRPSVAVLVGLAGPVLGGLLRWVLRRYLRWKLASILQDRTDSIKVPAT